MKTRQKLITVVVTATLMTPALSEESKGFYVMPEVGIVKLSDYCDNARGPATVVTSCEDSEFGFGLTGGYWFSDFISAEAGFRLGSGYDVAGTVTVGGTSVSLSGDLEYSSISFGGRLNYPLGTSGFALTGKAGLHRWSTELGIGNVGGIENDGFDIYGGVGANYSITDEIVLQGEYSYYKTGYSDIYEDVAHAFTGSLLYHF